METTNQVVSQVDREVELGIVEAIQDSLDFINNDVKALRYCESELKEIIMSYTYKIRYLLIRQYREDYEI